MGLLGVLENSVAGRPLAPFIGCGTWDAGGAGGAGGSKPYRTGATIVRLARVEAKVRTTGARLLVALFFGAIVPDSSVP